jgi:peptide/nickel transport system substrate-binding protein
MRWIKRLCVLLLCAAMTLAAFGCGGQSDGTAQLQNGATFTVAVAEMPDSLNPVMSEGGGLAEEFFLLCYDPLWRLDESGEPVPCLVESYSLSSDKLTWTIRLRQDVTFSDGVPLTAKDVQFTYDLMRRNSQAYKDYFDGVTAIRCPDDYTLVISTEYVKGDMLYNPTPILPEHIWSSYEFSPESFENTQLIGSGPFVYDWANDAVDGWLFLAREDYFQGAAQIGAVCFSYYSTVTGAARALATGLTDASFGLTDVQLTTLESVPGVELVQAMLPEAECRAIAFNTRSALFRSQTMRQTMEYCMNRAWFLSMSSGGAGMTGSVFASPGTDYFLQVSDLRDYDLSFAASQLRAAGYADSDEDGILEDINGEKLSLVIYTSSQDAWAATAATIFEQDMEQLGVSLTWYKTDDPITQVCGDSTGWDMCTYSWQGSVDATLAGTRFLTDVGGLTGWSDSTYESVLEQLYTQQDSQSAKGYIQQLQQIVYDDCPVVVLGYGADIQAIRSDSWTGYEDILASSGALFGTGSYGIYMSVTPVEQ